jgi:hypothetical protein
MTRIPRPYLAQSPRDGTMPAAHPETVAIIVIDIILPQIKGL